MRYPPPSYACTVWLTGETLHAWFDGTGPSGQGHAVHFEASVAGLKALLVTLKEREREGRRTIGHETDPTQADFEELIRKFSGKVTKPALKGKTAEPARQEARKTLELTPELLALLRN